MTGFGGQTVTFVKLSDAGDIGRLGRMTQSRTETSVSGCHFRPASSTESPDNETVAATGLWKCTAPPAPAVLTATACDEVIVDAVTYQIEGPVAPKYDLDGSVHHVTVMCKRQEI